MTYPGVRPRINSAAGLNVGATAGRRLKAFGSSTMDFRAARMPPARCCFASRSHLVPALLTLSVIMGASVRLCAQSSAAKDFPPSEWQPLAGDFEPDDYVGPRVCAQCHAKIARSQETTPMGHAAEDAGDCRNLIRHPVMHFALGPFQYTIHRDGKRSIFSVTDGTHSISTPILWAFGLGKAGQTYILKWKETYYQSRVSFFEELQGLDVTLGAPEPRPAPLKKHWERRWTPRRSGNALPATPRAPSSTSKFKRNISYPVSPARIATALAQHTWRR